MSTCWAEFSALFLSTLLSNHLLCLAQTFAVMERVTFELEVLVSSPVQRNCFTCAGTNTCACLVSLLNKCVHPSLHCTKTYFTVVWVTSPSDKSQQSSWLSTRLRSFYSSVSVTSLVCLSIRLAAWLPLSSQVSQTKQSATLGGVIVGQTAHGSWTL